MKSQIFLNMSELFNTLIQSSGESGDVYTILNDIAEIARIQLAASACMIQARNPITGRLIEPLMISQRCSAIADEKVFASLCSEELAQVVAERDIVLIEDLEHDTACEPVLVDVLKNIPRTRAFVALSLCIKDRQKTLGTLYLSYQEPQVFSRADAEHFQIFADQVSLVLQEAWLRQRYREVARIGQDINHELSDENIIFAKLKNHIGSILDADYALMLAVYKLQSRKLDIYQAEEGRLIVDPNQEFEGACQYVIETRQPLFIRQRSEEAKELPFQIALIKGTEPEESFIFVPLMLLGEPIGVLSIQHPQPNAYTQEDQFVLELLANHVALALYNARLYRNLNLLYDTGQILTQQFEATSTPQTIVDNIKKATKADLIVLYSYDAASGRFVQPVCMAGMLTDPTLQSTPDPLYPGSTARMLLGRGESIFARESDTLYASLLGDSANIQNTRFYQRENVCSTAAVPLLVEEKAVGMLFVNFRQPQRFDPTQKVLIEGLAHYAAIAIKNAQTFERLSERRIHELETLQKIDSALNTPDPELKAVLNTILSLAHEQIHPDHSALLLYDAQKQVWTFGAATGPSAAARMARPFMAMEQKGIICWVLQQKKTALVKNVYQDAPWCDHYFKTI
ncbi:MAG TPA: GAF domain-containing protein, partial [Ktedonobacteraceae bacterium]|nr:GAF domain-containing protein [Ktedonobacteraceae bacterium]